MYCIVWAQKMAATCSTATSTARVSEEHGLASEDIKQILSVSIVEENLPTCSQPESSTGDEPDNTEIASDSERGSTNDSTDENDVNKLRRVLEKVTPEGIRHRQLSMLMKNAETHQNATRAHRDDCLARRPQFLVDLGVESESQINRRVIDPDEPLLLTLEQMEQQATKRREERIQAQRKQQEKEQAREAFTNPWLIAMETGMAECNRRLEGTQDAEMALKDQFGNNVFHLQIRTGNKTILIYQFGNNVSHLQLGTRNKAALNDQLIRNNVFHLQIRTGNKTILIYQFGNNVFYLEIGTRNKAVLNDQFKNNVFHSQMGTPTKTFLNDQRGNSVFHLQIATRNKTVLIYQCGNNVFHLQIGTRNEMFLFYTRVKVLFPPCKSWSFYSQKEQKTWNNRYQRNVPL